MKNPYWDTGSRIALWIFAIALVGGVAAILIALLQGLQNAEWGA